MDYDHGAATRHVRWLMGRYQTGWCEFRGLGKDRMPRRLSVEIEALMGAGIDHAHGEIGKWVRDGYDVYVGVLPRVRQHMVAGKAGADAILAAGVFWVDLDRKVPGATVDRLSGCQLVIDTGNGWHGYEPMPRSVEITPANRQAIPKVIRAWQEACLPGTDNVSDLPRIMRLAGSINHKGEPKAVQIVRLDEPKPKPVVIRSAPKRTIGQSNPPDWTAEEEATYRLIHGLDAILAPADAAREASIPWPTESALHNRMAWSERTLLRMVARGESLDRVYDFAESEGIGRDKVGELIDRLEGI